MDTKHTPGPWRAEWTTRRAEGEERGWHVFEEENTDDGMLIELPDQYGDNHEANARLIAAAPELLEVARMTVTHIENIQENCPLTEHEEALLQAADAAIAKATQP